MNIKMLKLVSKDTVGVWFSFLIVLLSVTTSELVLAADRFAPPNLNNSLSKFDKRLKSSIFNVDFLVAHVLNNARQVEQLGENIRSDVSVFSDAADSINGSISNSVIIPPGTKADTIIVINQNEGDSYAIQR